MQNGAARLLTGTKKFDRITPVLKSLQWLPVEKRIDFTALLLVYHAFHDRLRNISEVSSRRELMFKHCTAQSSTSSSEQIQRLSEMILLTALKLGDALSGCITDGKSIGALMKSLKTHLFKSILIRCNLFSCIFVCHVNPLKMTC